MSKHKMLILMVIFSISTSYSQDVPKLDDFGRIVLNTYLPVKLKIPEESRSLLETKLTQIASNYGMGGSAVNPRFIITANVNIGTKDIIAGPPQMIAQNIDLTLFIGDAVENKVFCNTVISLKGVGTNENKAFIDAIKQINPKGKEIEKFVENGKAKIVSYYSTQCDFILKNVKNLADQEKYDEAIYELTIVPEVCQSCYFRCLDTLSVIYNKKINTEGQKKLLQAKIVWAANPNADGAAQATDILAIIKPDASCQNEVKNFINEMELKLKEDEKEKMKLFIKQYEDELSLQKEQIRIAEEKSKRDDEFREKEAVRNTELDKIWVDTYRKVAIEYTKNQPKFIYNISW